LEFFKNLGYEPEIVPNGKKCLEKLKEKDFDIVFMDCQMPEMDGYEASLRIKNGECQNNKIPVIIALTAHIGEEDRKKCMDYKMDDFISKPVNMKQLKAVLEKWL
jgi:CheY-like chemotaxis protein